MTRFRLLRPIAATRISGALVAAGDLSATTGGGGSAYDAAAQNAAYDALYDAAMGSNSATAKWVATNGNDTTGNGTSGNPYLTIGKAISVMSAGGEVIVKDGTYSGTANWISTVQVTIPNGSAGAYTRIRAENRFGVRITMSAAPSGYGDCPINLGSKQYVWVDGFIIESTFTASTGDGNDNTLVEYGSATHCRATRLIVKRKSCDQYGGAYSYGDGNVFEDCHHFGSSRYAYQGGTGGGSSPAGSTVLRRCVSYMPFGPVFEPTASFNFYGSNTSSYDLCKDVLFANCYEIDSPHLPQKGGQNPEDLKWGSFYHPKSVRNVEHIGCGVINCGAEYGGIRYDNYGGAGAALGSIVDCFVVGFNNGSPGGAECFSKSSSNGSIPVTNCTGTGAPGGFAGIAGFTLTSNLTSGITYPVLRQGGNGAEQKYAIGAFLSERGDANYKTVQTSMRLWPFPYEDVIASVFSESITRVTQDVPTGVSASANPFAGTSINGDAKTFTRRVWESTGNATPSFAAGAGVY